MGWRKVPYIDRGAPDSDIYRALECLGAVSSDAALDLSAGKLNIRIGQENCKDGTEMCQVWVYRPPGISEPVLALALDRSLKRAVPNDPTSPAQTDIWFVTLGILEGSGLDADAIYNILKSELKTSGHHAGKKFALIWHARKTRFQDEYDAATSPVDAVVEVMRKKPTSELTMTPDPRTATSIPSVAGHAHFEAYLKAKMRPNKVRTILFEFV